MDGDGAFTAELGERFSLVGRLLDLGAEVCGLKFGLIMFNLYQDHEHFPCEER
jgi:hypothetical protein